MSSAHAADSEFHSPKVAPPMAWVALAGLSLFLAASALSFWPYTVDDAFISLRYAQNLVEHGELAWNPGERVEGISNPLWTLWAALGLVAKAPIVLWLKVSGLLAGLALVPLTFLLSRRVGLSVAVGLGAAAIVATNASLAIWSVGGLETASFALLLTLFALRMESELKARAAGGSPLPLSALLFFLCWASRPEAPAYALYILVRRLLVPGRLPLDRKDLQWVLVAGLPIAAYEVFGLVYFGGLLPATHTAKLGGGSSFFGGDFSRFLGTRFLFGQGPLFAALWVAGALGALSAIRRVPAAAWAMSLAGLVFVAYAFTDWMPRFRFFVPPLPFLAIACAFGLERLSSLVTRQSRLGMAAAMVLVIGGSAFDQATRGYDRDRGTPMAIEPRGAWPLRVLDTAAAAWEPGRQEMDAWMILQETAQGDAIACPDIGFIGALTRNPIWDFRGLVTPKAAAFLHVEESSPDFESVRRAMLDDMFALRPALILVPKRLKGMAPVPRRFAAALRSDPRTSSLYEEINGMLPMRVVWRRRDLKPPAPEARSARIERALAQLPSYGTDLMKRIRR